MNHEYTPDPIDGKCVECLDNPPKPWGRGQCLWCGHGRSLHTGRPPKEVIAHYALKNANGEVVGSRVVWTPTACGQAHCACRRYES